MGSSIPMYKDHRVGDIAYYANNRIKFINYKYWNDRIGIPIAVCIMPTNHAAIVDNGKARFIAIAGVTEDGQQSLEEHKLLYYNQEDIGLVKYTKVPNWDNTREGPKTSSANGYTSSDNFTGATNVIDTKTKYYDNRVNPLIPSPYESDETFYQDYIRIIEGNNMLSDFSGKGNTIAIARLEIGGTGAEACRNYTSAGTSKGDWYLPACGEITYIIPRFKVISEALAAVNGTPLKENTYWTSTEFDTNKGCCIATNFGGVVSFNKSNSYYVRPVIQFE